MVRNEIILRHIKKHGHGVEIGPSHNPVAPKRDGYKVHIIDHMTREQLIEKYKDHNVQLDNIEEVDFVWTGSSYPALINKVKYYDWIIASHLIEHTPDLIGFVNDCDSILNNDGVISLVIPDMRYCFDHFRPLSGVGQIIDAHINKYTIHTQGTAAEYFLNVVSKGNTIAWDEHNQGNYAFVHSLHDASAAMRNIGDNNAYLDLHAWCFTPHSFRLTIHDLHSLGLIPVKEISFHPTIGCEFYITLGRNGDGLQLDRLDMLKAIESEMVCK